MEYKILTKKDLETIQPNTGNIDLNKLNSAELNNYIELYCKYRQLFTEFLIKKLNLKEYDNIIGNSNLNIPVTPEENMDIYQYFSSNILKYVYVRNNIYIERLTQEEIEYLKKIDSLEIGNNTDVLNFINSTYKKVIFEDVSKNKEKHTIMFGPDSKDYLSSNYSVVIGLRYDEFYDEPEETNDKWEELYYQRELFISNVIKKMENDLNNILETPISILWYNEYSINSLNKRK